MECDVYIHTQKEAIRPPIDLRIPYTLKHPHIFYIEQDSLVIGPRNVPQLEEIRRDLLFVRGRSQPRAAEELAAGQHHHQDHHDAQQEIDDAQVYEREDVEGAMTPPIRLEEGGGGVIRPLDPQDPVVAQGEPDDEEYGEGDGGHLGDGGGGVDGPHVQPTGMQLGVEGEAHLDAADATAHDHVDGDVGLPGAVPEELES